MAGEPDSKKPTTPPLTRGRAGEQKANPKNHEDSDSDNFDDDENVSAKQSKATGGQQPAGGKSENTPISQDEISKRFKDLILEERKGLQKMYGETEADLDRNLDVQIKKGEEMAKNLMDEKRMGYDRETAKDLTVLMLYDVAILIDDSDSMIYEEGGKRKDTLVHFIDQITKIYTMANESGILALRFMNSPRGKKNWKGESLKGYLDRHEYGGLTRIGTTLKEKILDLFAIGNSNQSKPLLVLIVTDGAVAGERKGRLKRVIRDCVNEREEAGKGFDAVSFQFSRIGNDPGAAELLKGLDQDQTLGEYIDVLPVEFDLETQIKDPFVLPKILLGAILPDWNEQDDYDSGVKDHLDSKASQGGIHEVVWDSEDD